MGRSRYKITDPQQPYFVTLTVLHWIPVFTRPNTVNILLNTLRFLGKEGLKVYAYVVLENQCHFVLQSDVLDKDIGRLKFCLDESYKTALWQVSRHYPLRNARTRHGSDSRW